MVVVGHCLTLHKRTGLHIVSSGKMEIKSMASTLHVLLLCPCKLETHKQNHKLWIIYIRGISNCKEMNSWYILQFTAWPQGFLFCSRGCVYGCHVFDDRIISIRGQDSWFGIILWPEVSSPPCTPAPFRNQGLNVGCGRSSRPSEHTARTWCMSRHVYI